MFQTNLTLPEHWEYILETRLLQAPDCRRKNIYICSPCRGKTAKDTQRNILAARFYMFHVWDKLGHHARAPHGYVSMVLNDNSCHERALALQFGENLLLLCDGLYVCGDKLSSGMRNEIERAVVFGLPITVFHPDLVLDVVKIVTRRGGDKKLVSYDSSHPELSLNSEELFSEAKSSADTYVFGGTEVT